ncbi:MAG: DUF3127 domain-containing protein [Bacteroidaceae bacterium]|nr:DUF3127 domain-containing protein [Bacteroidaceae bacterium]
MEITGKIIAVLPLLTGEGRNGAWKKQDYVVETQEEYPKKMSFNLWGDKVEKFNIQLGEMLTISFDIDCREYKGRWYNDIKAWRVERVAQEQTTAGAATGTVPPPMEMLESGDNEDLPF